MVAFSNRKLALPHVLVLKTGLNIVLACNIPKDSPMLEVPTATGGLISAWQSSDGVYLTLTFSWFQAAAERKLVEKLKGLDHVRTAADKASTSIAH
jgi:proteasome assembly chaperone 4